MSCIEFQNNLILKVQTLHLQFFCSCLNESFNRCNSCWLSGSELLKSLSRLTQEFLKVVDKLWWVQIMLIFFPLEQWMRSFCLHMWPLQSTGTTLTKNCIFLLQYQKIRQLCLMTYSCMWVRLVCVHNRFEEHKRWNNINYWSVYSVVWEKWTSEGGTDKQWTVI